MKKTVFLILLSLLISLLEYSLFPYLSWVLELFLINFCVSLFLVSLGSLDDAMIVGLFGGLFESFLGTKSIGIYSVFYCCSIYIIYYIKKHIIDNPIADALMYTICILIYFRVSLAAVIINLVVAIPLIILVKVFRK